MRHTLCATDGQHFRPFPVLLGALKTFKDFDCAAVGSAYKLC